MTLIQSQIDFEKIRKDIEQKKLKKKSDEDWLIIILSQLLQSIHKIVVNIHKSYLFTTSGLNIIINNQAKRETYHIP